MMSMSRLCKDCCWAALEENESGMVWRCTHPRSKFVPPPDLVTGKSVQGATAELLRSPVF
jgi:hypothetical protein